MIPFDRIQALFQRLASYPLLEVLIELALIWIVVFLIVRFVRGTRAAGALKGLILILVIATILARLLGQGQSFQRITFLFDRVLAIAAVGLLIIFQPELRRALVRLGETPFFRGTSSEIANVVEPIVEACAYLSRSKFGALIVIERQVGLSGIVEGGTEINSGISAALLQTIFFPGTALHDLAVVVQGNQIKAAGVQLPLADPIDMPDRKLGSRHRAAVGLSKECDAIVVVVSEETGQIRIAERGRLVGDYSPEELGDELARRLRTVPPSAANQTAEHEAPPPRAEPTEPVA